LVRGRGKKVMTPTTAHINQSHSGRTYSEKTLGGSSSQQLISNVNSKNVQIGSK
jgi:hypothetical protein